MVSKEDFHLNLIAFFKRVETTMYVYIYMRHVYSLPPILMNIFRWVETTNWFSSGGVRAMGDL